MFKRVEKHRQKKEDADNLELDDRWQEILGFHDTDSEESDSEGSNDEDEDELEMRTSDSGGRDYPDDEEGEDQAVTVSQALIDPLYVASTLQTDVKACIICPGKVLKGLKMDEIHLASNAHVRRFKHFNRLATDAEPTESARKLFRSFTKIDLNESSLKPISKRAEKRMIYHERRKQRRGKFKERMVKKAEQAILSEPGPVEAKPSTPKEEKRPRKPRSNDDLAKIETEKSSPIKKRKINKSHAPAAPSEISPKRQKTMVETKESHESGEKSTMVTRIVSSTADRAKKARLKAIRSKVSFNRHSKTSEHLS